MDDKIKALKKAIDALPANLADGALRMESLLAPAAAALPALLADKAAWQSLYIDYEPPFLMRLYLPVCGESGDKQAYLSLHYFFGVPDAKGASDAAGLVNPYAGRPELAQVESVNNYHPHPWASTFKILDGSYKQQIGLAKELGYSEAVKPVPHAVWEQDAKDPAKNTYTFNDPLMWHRVLPSDGKPVCSLMITYVPKDWSQSGPKPAQKQRPLSAEERDFMFAHFEKIFAPVAKPEPFKKHGLG